MPALTITRGHTVTTSTETNSPTRETGQFGSTHKSCPIRSASSHRVLLPIGSMTPTAGAVVIEFDPDNAHNGGSQPANGRLFCWRTDANNLIEVEYDKASARFEARRLSGGAGGEVTLAATFNAGDAMAVYVGWSATTIELAVNGGAISSAANTNIPASLPSTADIGSTTGSSNHFQAAYGSVAMFTSQIALAAWQTLAALRATRPALFGETIPSQWTAYWMGGHTAVWTTPEATIDAFVSPYDLIGVQGAGIPQVQSREISTVLRDGATFVDALLNVRNFVLDLRVFGATWDALFSARRALLAAVNPRAPSPLCTIQFAPSNTVYELTALLTGAPYDNLVGTLRQQVMCTFRAYDPAWRIATRNDALYSIPQGGWSIMWTIPWTITASTHTQTLSNDGELATYPVIVITAGASGCQGPGASNDTSGQHFHLESLVLAAGESVEIDMDARTAYVGSENVYSSRSSDSQAWALEKGNNSVSLFVNGGSATGVVRYHSRLLGV